MSGSGFCAILGSDPAGVGVGFMGSDPGEWIVGSGLKDRGSGHDVGSDPDVMGVGVMGSDPGRGIMECLDAMRRASRSKDSA